MNALKSLIDLLGGKYFEEEIKKGYTPGGTFISQNSYGLLQKEDYTIRIYCFSNTGTKDPTSIEGSPYKIVLSFPFILKNNLTIFPKTFTQRIFSKLRTNKIKSEKTKPLIKKYSLKGNRTLTNYILNDDLLTEELPKHDIYISSKTENEKHFVNLIPNESIFTIEDLKALYVIMDKLGEIISRNKSILSK